jgi:hypothetical protein
VAESVIPKSLLATLPRTIREELPTLPKESQEKFLQLYQKRIKKLWKAYPLCLLYGMHFVYLEETSTGIWFWFTVGGFGVWWVIELLRLPGMVKNHNSMAAIKIMGQVRPIGEKLKF